MNKNIFTKVIMIQPLGIMNACAKFHGSPSNSRSDNSVWNKMVDWLSHRQKDRQTHAPSEAKKLYKECKNDCLNQ